MPSFLVSNADKSVNVSHVEADDAASAVEIVAEGANVSSETLKAVDHQKLEAEYWAKMSPSAAKPIPSPPETKPEADES